MLIPSLTYCHFIVAMKKSNRYTFDDDDEVTITATMEGVGCIVDHMLIDAGPELRRSTLKRAADP